MPLKIIIDDKAGPCGGVKRVIRLTEQNLAAGYKTVSLGAVIHNEVEISRLRDLGMAEVDHSVLDKGGNGGEPQRVVIRAHGEAPEVFERAKERGLNVVDGTCPVVTRSQRYAQKYHEQGYQVVVVGKPKHAEVIGILGYCDNEAKVVHEEADVAELEPDRPTYVLAQTTISDEMWNSMLAAIQDRVSDVTSRNTICAFVADRENELRTFARSCDAIIFVGGKNSSNTHVMYDVCQSVNPRSYWIETAKEVEASWLDGIESVGISGSASTPQWLLEVVGEALARRFTERVAAAT
ncbi:MAG: 4-hydroxy-3-methylbut-2-enyl diphosphate reductase [candidate division Zixibacteria bacterium]|nr:4-hydroxy-3-methylbut-2-enyl diphosphate reductase [candidate division Zixibacteria bacterium]